jgi:hypothetical protein
VIHEALEVCMHIPHPFSRVYDGFSGRTLKLHLDRHREPCWSVARSAFLPSSHLSGSSRARARPASGCSRGAALLLRHGLSRSVLPASVSQGPCGSGSGPPQRGIHSGALCRPSQGRPGPGGMAVGPTTGGGRAGVGARLCAPSQPPIWSSSCRRSAAASLACPTPSTCSPSSPPGDAAPAPPGARGAAPTIRPAPRLPCAPASSGTASGPEGGLAKRRSAAPPRAALWRPAAPLPLSGPSLPPSAHGSAAHHRPALAPCGR